MKIDFSSHENNFFLLDDECPAGGTYRDGLLVIGACQAAEARRNDNGAKAPVLFYFILASWAFTSAVTSLLSASLMYSG